MRVARRATAPPLSPAVEGLLGGLLGVTLFSVTLPVTRIAELGGLDPSFVGLGRALLAATLAGLILYVRREPLPPRRYWRSLAITASGVVFGFPLLSALALRSLPAAHGAVITGFLPAATALMAVARAGERPSRGFWGASALGLLTIIAFTVVSGAGRPQWGDLLLLGAVALGGLGYAEGGKLARDLGGWRVICWTLLGSAPLLLPLVATIVIRTPPVATPAAWAGFIYAAVISQLLGFFAWYHGLARGGVARVGQIQLIQPILTLLWSVLLLQERISGAMVIAAVLVIGSVALSRRTAVATTVPGAPALWATKARR